MKTNKKQMFSTCKYILCAAAVLPVIAVQSAKIIGGVSYYMYLFTSLLPKGLI